jgi:hypothetical protein
MRRATAIRVLVWGGVGTLLLLLFSDSHYSTQSGLTVYWPWQDCSDARDPERIQMCAMRNCETTLRSALNLQVGALIEGRVTYSSTDDDRAIHVLRIHGSTPQGQLETWAVCVSRGTDTIKARAVTADIANRFAYGQGNIDDL